MSLIHGLKDERRWLISCPLLENQSGSKELIYSIVSDDERS